MLYNAIIVLVVILLLQAFIVPLVNQSQVTDVTYDQFIAMLDAGNVTQVALENGTIVFIAEDEATGASRIWPRRSKP